MTEQIHAPLAGALVIHPNGATIFGAVGEPVSPDARMGAAEAAARTRISMTAPTRPSRDRGLNSPTAFWAPSPAPSR
jgi:hypothetical protein